MSASTRDANGRTINVRTVARVITEPMTFGFIQANLHSLKREINENPTSRAAV